MSLIFYQLIYTGNLGSLPLIIVPAICKGRSHPFGDVDACYRKGLAFTSLTMAVRHTDSNYLKFITIYV